ncbi:formimidoylglutamase [Camelliibacillus cellulosilyticus]|uniref:Formimidoylglutamase n=1 Tax=Camelliibacillus cellulosilyticus TaxID=2174486 RepID=A0ABV9GMQ6_9BACL
MYEVANQKLWTGRTDSLTERSMFRMHQVVQAIDLSTFNEKQTDLSFGFIGFKSDEGVRRNQGRIGAAEGPDHVRTALASLPNFLAPSQRFFDVGNICCEGKNLEEAQQALGEAVEKMLSLGIFPLIVGGGHEVAYGHYLGAAPQVPAGKTLGILNIDAHFDLRSYEAEPSSGTMFRQILDGSRRCDYMCIGIQRTGNTQYLFETADAYGCQYILEEDINGSSLGKVRDQISHFITKHDFILLTLCCDVLAADAAPGVSAPSPFGMEPKLVRAILKHAITFNNILGFDIAEISPPLDENGKTVKLGAQMLHEIMSAKGEA